MKKNIHGHSLNCSVVVFILFANHHRHHNHQWAIKTDQCKNKKTKQNKKQVSYSGDVFFLFYSAFNLIIENRQQHRQDKHLPIYLCHTFSLTRKKTRTTLHYMWQTKCPKQENNLNLLPSPSSSFFLGLIFFLWSSLSLSLCVCVCQSVFSV